MASSARIEELRKKFEENPRRYFAPLANEYRKAGDVDQAIAICREYLPQQPGHMSGHIVYGQALYEGRQFEEAKTVFETALSLDPENLIALRHLGDISLIVGDADAARTWYKRVLEADPRNEEIQAQLASLDLSAASPAAEASAPTNISDKPTAPAGTPIIAEVPSAPVSSAPPKPPTPAAGTPAVTATDTPTAEITLDAVPVLSLMTPVVPAAVVPEADRAVSSPGASPEQGAPSIPQTLELESPVAGAAPSATAPAVDSSSPLGLETTSLVVEAPVPSLSTAPTVELDVGAFIPPSAPLSAPPSAPPSAAPAVSPSAIEGSTADVPRERPDELPAMPPAMSPVPDLPFIDVGPSAAAEAARPQPASDSSPFVTETMAELYLQQGHREEALRVYKALLEQRPGDAALQAKVADLQPTPEPTVPARMSFELTAPVTERTIREVLTALALRLPGARIDTVPTIGVSTESVVAQNSGLPEAPARTLTAGEPKSAAPAASPESAQPVSSAAPPPARVDTIAALFGGVVIAPADEGAAQALALAFAGSNGSPRDNSGSPSSGVAGSPARRASNELSLDAVFGGEAGSSAAPSTFSFDQFFSPRASTHQGSAAPASGANSVPSDDVAHFTKWLEGLKQR